MITIDDKLFITKEVNQIVVSYAKHVVLRKLLTQFSFTFYEEQQHVSELIKKVSSYYGDLPDYEQQQDMIVLIADFLNTCSKEELTSLYFWLLNEKYMEYYNGFTVELEDSDDYMERFNSKFGRELAYKLYNPESSELGEELRNELQKTLIAFASEFCSSLVFADENSTIEVEEMIERYCN
jgi:hypothetical protein